MIPAILMVVLFRFFPIANAFRMSVFDWNGYSQEMTFNGLDNFKELFHDNYFWKALRNTLIYAFGITIVKNILGLGLALFANMKFPGRGVVRAVVYLPNMISGFIMGQIMYYFFQYQGGIFNEIGGYFGHEPIYWMATDASALVVVLLTTSILHCGATMLTYLAGLQHIPNELRESARLDGANTWNEFLHVTLPLLNPSIVTSVVLNLIGSFKIYDIISALSKGGPDGGSQSLTMLISSYYYGYNRAGYAAAIAAVFFLVVVVISWPINLWLSSKKVQL
jgi:raffinose/stachyose/melibiose transport system permease protein